MTNYATEDQVRSLIALGECMTVEYKSSLRWDYKESRVNKELTKAVVRTMAGFLNSQGGVLLIGIDDDGTPLDLKADLNSLSPASQNKFQLTFRGAIANYLGEDVDPWIDLEFATFDDKQVAVARCAAHSLPVYFRDGNRRELYVRSGNLTRSLDVAAAVSYVNKRWVSPASVMENRLRLLLADAFAGSLRGDSTSDTNMEQLPVWVKLATRRVLDLFLINLSRAHRWQRIDIISPWISEIPGSAAALNFSQLLRRARDENTTMYIVTRPPEEEWHKRAIRLLAESGRANISLLPELHTKLFTAETVESTFAMMGSANFTVQSLANREIGVLISSTGDGKALVRDLKYEAAEIYRHPNRKLICQAKL